MDNHREQQLLIHKCLACKKNNDNCLHLNDIPNCQSTFFGMNNCHLTIVCILLSLPNCQLTIIWHEQLLINNYLVWIIVNQQLCIPPAISYTLKDNKPLTKLSPFFWLLVSREIFWCRAESKTILRVCKTLQRVKKIQVCIFSFFMPNSAQHVLFSIDYLLSTHRKIDSKPGLQSGSH